MNKTFLRFHFRGLLLATIAAACGGSSDSKPEPEPPDETSWDEILASRVVDYNAALKKASMRLTGLLPTIADIDAIQMAGDLAAQKLVYDGLIASYLESPQFHQQMRFFWRNVFKMRGGFNTYDGNSVSDMAAWITVTGQPYTNILTTPTGMCGTTDPGTMVFTPADCRNNVDVHSGVLTHPAVMQAFFSNLAFRRVRWVQETFLCTTFPAEYSSAPIDVGGVGPYTGTFPFESIAGADNGGRIDFHEVGSNLCANCHANMNHLAPLFAYFTPAGVNQATVDAAGNVVELQPGIHVRLPSNEFAQLTDWLPPGEGTAYRAGIPVATLPELGRAMAADPKVAECAVARAWNFAMGKEDIVDAHAQVPSEIIAPIVADFVAGNFNLKTAFYNVFTSDDFTKF